MSPESDITSTDMTSGQPAADRKQSRRALFAGAVGAGAGAVAVTVLGGAQPASAANGDQVTLGTLNGATATTTISTTGGTGLTGSTSDS